MAKKKIAATPADKPPRLPGNRTTKGSRKPVVKPYEPSQNHLEWYKLWTEGHLRPSAIAERFNVSRQSVLGAIRRVADWMRLETFDDIIEIRYRQQAALEHVAALALQAFVQSAGEHTIVTVRKVTGDKSTETTKRTEHLAGNPAFLAQYCAAVAQINKLWGVDRPIVKDEPKMDSDGLERVSGMSRAAAIRMQAELMLKSAHELENAQDASKPA